MSLPPPASDDAGAAPPPDLGAAARLLGQDAAALGRAGWDTLRGFRTLLAADLALSRSALVLTLVYASIALALGASSWLLLMALAVVLLQAAGLEWWLAVAIPCGVSLSGTLLCAWLAMRVFRDTRMDATRRQFARLAGAVGAAAHASTSVSTDPAGTSRVKTGTGATDTTGHTGGGA